MARDTWQDSVLIGPPVRGSASWGTWGGAPGYGSATGSKFPCGVAKVRLSVAAAGIWRNRIEGEGRRVISVSMLFSQGKMQKMDGSGKCGRMKGVNRGGD